ncbi:MAG: DoxX family protein [Planctomycetaceae bacterium]|nr:DoxX family protein [Planctomycetaceae bacterium]
MSNSPVVSKTQYRTGWILCLLPSLLLTISGVMKLVQPEGMAKDVEKLGWSIEPMLYIGIVELACTVLYLFPPTSILGAILLTGYLGGATATHLRLNDPSGFVAVLIGVVLWLGLFLREPRLRVLIPFRR